MTDDGSHRFTSRSMSLANLRDGLLEKRFSDRVYVYNIILRADLVPYDFYRLCDAISADRLILSSLIVELC